MAYIQLALYGVPAIVRCGNTLTQEMRFKMETPLFFLHYSKFRKFYMQNQKEIKKNTIILKNNEEFNIGRKFKNNVIQKYKEHFLR